MEKIRLLEKEFTKKGIVYKQIERNGYQHVNIIKCCNGKLKSHKGFIWRYKNG